MNRRGFIGTALAFFTIGAPKVVRAGTPIADPGFLVTGKTISYTGTGTFTVAELYRALQDMWDEPERMPDPMPSMRYTDKYITLTNGYTIDSSVGCNVRDGMIKCDNELWTSGLTTIGDVPVQYTQLAEGLAHN